MHPALKDASQQLQAALTAWTNASAGVAQQMQAELLADIEGLRADATSLRREMAEVREEMAALRAENKEHRATISAMKKTQDEAAGWVTQHVNAEAVMQAVQAVEMERKDTCINLGSSPTASSHPPAPKVGPVQEEDAGDAPAPTPAEQAAAPVGQTVLMARGDIPAASSLTAADIGNRIQVTGTGDVVVCQRRDEHTFGWKKVKPDQMTAREQHYKQTLRENAPQAAPAPAPVPAPRQPQPSPSGPAFPQHPADAGIRQPPAGGSLNSSAVLSSTAGWQDLPGEPEPW